MTKELLLRRRRWWRWLWWCYADDGDDDEDDNDDYDDDDVLLIIIGNHSYERLRLYFLNLGIWVWMTYLRRVWSYQSQCAANVLIFNSGL